MNKVDLVGHLTTDPVLQFLGDGRAICKFRMATKSGRDKTADIHNVVIHARRPEDAHPKNVAEILSKGWRVWVIGKITENTWTSRKDGRLMSRTEILASHIEFLSSPQTREEINEPDGIEHEPEPELSGDSDGFTESVASNPGAGI